ncbi:MAG TPA: roadblock/LC7 domain-containing protein [Polyangiaceae bacterium]|nr:roadblock/LC7 domain-containing protein [Polyangiaceae bacterium]
MKDFNVIAKFPEVQGAVLSDPSGALLDVAGNIDGEVAGAVHAYSMKSLGQAGELLGLGGIQRTAIVGPTKSVVITIHDQEILGVYVDPDKPLAAIEKKLQDTPKR